jgi:2-polyprenyl-3-methyl-5-hydroxy-6-metoxy-1,4-benzoquinol methylase
MSEAGAAQQTESPAVPLMFRDAVGWFAIVLLTLGRETGMLDAIIANPATASELASRCQVDERNAAAWLAAMAAHGYLSHRDGVFTMLPSEAAAFRGQVLPFDFFAILDFTRRSPNCFGAVIDAIRTGRGVAPSVYHDVFGETMGDINLPLYGLMLIDEWLAQAGLRDDLQRGIDVAELGCAAGKTLLMLGERCPASNFTGYDLDARALQAAGAEADRRGLTNVRFQVADANSLSGSYDLIFVLDAFHHFQQPDTALHSIAAALRPGGKLVLVEATATGNLDLDAAMPWSRIVFSANVLFCLQEALHENGAGLGSTAGAQRITALLEENEFGPVSQYDSAAGYTIYTATTRRSV